jgi:protocatechuate 3,4-dioxygenase beta subunit
MATVAGEGGLQNLPRFNRAAKKTYAAVVARVDHNPKTRNAVGGAMFRTDFPYDELVLSRRRLLLASASVVAASLTPWRHGQAATLVPTPPQTAGPFYPKTLPLDADNDLVRIVGHKNAASGSVTHVFGRVLGAEGNVVPRARIEIWQCDSHGRYHYVDDRSSPPIDADFQGYGRTISGTDGAYRFRTIRPVAYPGRTPHIHFAISAPGAGRLITQMYVAGESLNDRDPILAQIYDPATRARVIVPLAPASQIEAGALAGSFDIVLGA